MDLVENGGEPFGDFRMPRAQALLEQFVRGRSLAAQIAFKAVDDVAEPVEMEMLHRGLERVERAEQGGLNLRGAPALRIRR